ncbi:MAG: hypothetical protein N2D54_08030, partial [Chloroflexota bacterium]
MKYKYLIAGESYTVKIEKNADGYVITIGEGTYIITNIRVQPNEIIFQLDDSAHRVHWAPENKGKRWIALDGKSYLVEKAAPGRRPAGQSGAGGNLVLSPMPGQVREVLAAEGDEVTRGQTLLILEAMKMEIRVQAPRDGIIIKLPVTVGQQVNKDE